MGEPKPNVRNTVAGFWKLAPPARWPPSSKPAQPPALHQLGPELFFYGSCESDRNAPLQIQKRLPFDPDEVFENYLFERYTPSASRLRDLYYRVRPWVPLSVRRAVQRWQATARDPTRFPRWPVEPSLIRFHQLLLDLALGGEEQHRYIDLWPAKRSFAFVLTHDVDSAEGFARMEEVARLERDLGFRSAWFIVPELYRVDWDRLARLAEDGFEIGIHGLRHDGRLFSSREVFTTRLAQIHAYARRVGAVGFRSPATLRRAEWLREIEFEYDASFFDTDPFEPQPGGTCSWFPFFNGELVELPYTLPQDFTLFEKLRVDAAAVWADKLARIERHRGMALMLTHPDYLDRSDRLDAYQRTLQWVTKRANCWRALPREVARWWRVRDAAHWRSDGSLEGDGSWRNELGTGLIRREDGEVRW